MRILKSKRAQEGGTNLYVIAMIVAIVLLVLVIFAFMQNWAGIRDKWNQFTGSSNVDDIKSACTIACQTGRAEDYNAVRPITYADGFKTTVTCKQLESPIMACLDNDQKVIPTATADSCAGKGNWVETPVCYYRVGNKIAESTITEAMCVGDFILKTGGVCVVEGVVSPQISKASCTGLGSWTQKEPTLLTETCTTI